MTIAKRAGVAVIGAVALGIGLSACGSDSSGEESAATSSSAPSESSATSAAPAAPATPAPAAGPGITIDQYAEENGITVTPVLRGEPGTPTINLPFPQGWEASGPRAPQGAYDALVYTADPAAQDPPTIVAFVTKLTGDVDPAKIIEYAPNEVRNLPGYQGPETGEKNSLGGYDATQIGGFYTKDGISRLIAQKTAVIPAQDGVFVLKLTADGSESLAMQLMEATAAIDEQTTIVP